MWLASPFSDNSSNLAAVLVFYGSGSVAGRYIAEIDSSSSNGFRPLVAIPKSSLK